MVKCDDKNCPGHPEPEVSTKVYDYAPCAVFTDHTGPVRVTVITTAPPPRCKYLRIIT